ncbi:MAG: diaminopimelate epimerase [Verrucomicrobiales bacterium]
MRRILHFTKMNGAGNDFVVVDNRDLSLALTSDQIARLCDRHRGVGADGLLAVEPARNGAAYRMRYYNADGGEAEMCGNGARCFARYVNKLNSFSLPAVAFETAVGGMNADFIGDAVRLRMTQPTGLSLNERLTVNERDLAVHFINTGVPHAVVVVDDLENVNVRRDGAALRYHERFSPKGANANFVRVLAPDLIAIRTYERGVENETLACGTGTVACAIVHHLLEGASPPIKVHVRGGDTLSIDFRREGDNFQEVTLTGLGEIVFEGKIEL